MRKKDKRKMEGNYFPASILWTFLNYFLFLAVKITLVNPIVLKTIHAAKGIPNGKVKPLVGVPVFVASAERVKLPDPETRLTTI